MKEISIQELTEKFGPSLNMPPWGECLVVPGTEFDPDWEVSLGDAGYRCHFTSLDSRAITAVQLKKSVAVGKMVYVPERAAAQAISSNGEVKILEKIRGKGCLKGPEWDDEQVSLLLILWEKHKNLPKERRAVELAKLPEFKGRSASSILQKAYMLSKMPKEQEEPKKVPEEPAESKTEEDDEVTMTEVLTHLAFNSKCCAELKIEHEELKLEIKKLDETLKACYSALAAFKRYLGEIDEDLVDHKHARSGEAMLPMPIKVEGPE